MKHGLSVLVAGIIISVWGCNSESTSGSTSPQAVQTAVSTGLAARKVQIAIVCPAAPAEMIEAIKSGADSAVETLEANDGLKISSSWRTYRSQSELQDALQTSALNHDQVVLLRPDPKFAIGTQLRQLHEVGTKVVTIGVDVKRDLRAVFCGIPDAKLGNRLAYSIGTGLKGPTDVGVIYSDDDREALGGLKEVAVRYPYLKLHLSHIAQVNVKAVLAAIRSNPGFRSWVVFESEALADPEQLQSLDPKKVSIYTLGCWPRQLPLLESGLLRPLSLPSYELGYLGVCRAIDIAAYHRKTDDTYMISTPIVGRNNVRGYAITLRRWGFSNVASKYLETIRGGENVR